MVTNWKGCGSGRGLFYNIVYVPTFSWRVCKMRHKIWSFPSVLRPRCQPAFLQYKSRIP